jgi:hypothetical protein
MSEAVPKKDIMKRMRQELEAEGLFPVTVYLRRSHPEDKLKLQKYVRGRLNGKYTARRV